MATVKEFLDLLYSQVDRGIYVWGGNGENLLCMDHPLEWIKKRETTAENARRAIALFEQRFADGIDPIQAFDCSGLVYWSQKQAGYGYHDMSANGFYSECKKVDKLTDGDLVFHHNGIKCTHVGVYVGYDTVIEAKGRDVGVVKTVYSKNAKYWNRQGRLKRMEDPEPKTHLHIRVKGVIKKDGNPQKSVNVRSGNGTMYPVVGVAHSTDCFPCYGQADASPYWYEIDYNGQRAYITSNSRYTEEIYKC